MSTREHKRPHGGLHGFPKGWFVIGWASELKPGDVRPLRYFGKDLVLFRTESGEAVVLDAFCPHLGAHLGHGGVVSGDAVVCPFHAWEFDGTGACTKVPYGSGKIPKKARVDAWSVCERNSVLYLWHDPAGGPPAWEVLAIPELYDEAWTPWYTNKLQVKTHPREIVENVADSAHFPVVHRTDVVAFGNEYIDHMATQRTEGIAVPPGGGKDHFKIEATYYGPAFQVSHMHGVLDSVLLLAHTPIGPNLLDLRFAVSIRKAGARTDQFAAMYVDNLTRGFHEDIDIWEHKLYRDVPRLVDGDGPIGRLRTWYRQFYTAPAPDEAASPS